MKIFVTRSIPEPGLKLLEKHHQVEVNHYDRVLTKEEIINTFCKGFKSPPFKAICHAGISGLRSPGIYAWEDVTGVKGKDGLLCLLTDLIDAEVINSEPKLKMIASYAVGYNNIDVKAASCSYSAILKF